MVSSAHASDPCRCCRRQAEGPDRSVSGLKIPFCALCLWPPIAFIAFVQKEMDTVSETVKLQTQIVIITSMVPLSVSFILAFISLCKCCVEKRFLRRWLLHSDCWLTMALLIAGAIIVAVIPYWPGDRRAVAFRILADVWGMACIHAGAAYWLYFYEGVDFSPSVIRKDTPTSVEDFQVSS